MVNGRQFNNGRRSTRPGAEPLIPIEIHLGELLTDEAEVPEVDGGCVATDGELVAVGTKSETGNDLWFGHSEGYQLVSGVGIQQTHCKCGIGHRHKAGVARQGNASIMRHRSSRDDK